MRSRHKRVGVVGVSVGTVLGTVFVMLNSPETPFLPAVASGAIIGSICVLLLAGIIAILGTQAGLAGICLVLFGTIWTLWGPVAAVLVGGGTAWLIWRARFRLARAFGVTVPEAATPPPPSSAP